MRNLTVNLAIAATISGVFAVMLSAQAAKGAAQLQSESVWPENETMIVFEIILVMLATAVLLLGLARRLKPEPVALTVRIPHNIGDAQFQDRRTTVKRELRLDRRCDAANSNLKTCL